METPIHDKIRVTIERYAEQGGIFLLRGGSFTHILRLNSLFIKRSIVGDDGNEVTLRGQDLVNTKTWESFLRQTEVNLSWLSYEAGVIATKYVRWLRSSYTKRYRVILSNDEITWLNQVAMLAVLWHMFQHKYTTHRFLDPWVESEMGKLLLIRDQSRTMARAVNHGKKGEPEQASLLLTQANESALALIENRTFAPYEAIALPPGMLDPLALPEEEKRDE